MNKTYTTSEILAIIDELLDKRSTAPVSSNPIADGVNLLNYAGAIEFHDELKGYFETDGEPNE